MVFPCRYYLVTSSICIALLQCIASAYVHCFWGLEIDGPGQSTTVGAPELETRQIALISRLFRKVEAVHSLPGHEFISGPQPRGNSGFNTNSPSSYFFTN